MEKNHKKILSDIHLNFEEGVFYGLIGKNGAGKTTLFKSILQLCDYEGDIYYNKKMVDVKKIGSIIESPNFYEQLSVMDNLQIHCNYLEEKTNNIEALLKKFDLFEQRDNKVNTLSLGMKQRLGIIRAFLGDKQIFLLDEPLNGLDPYWIKQCRFILKKDLYNKDNIVVISSHNLYELQLVVDKFIYMNDGKIICELENKDDYILLTTNKDINSPHFFPLNSSQYITSISSSKLNEELKKLDLDEFDKDIVGLEEIFELIIGKGNF